jgi:hypothetical protein
VIAIEPSDVMAAQRPADRVPAIRGSAGALPLRDRSVEAAIAIPSPPSSAISAAAPGTPATASYGRSTSTTSVYG